MSPLKVAHEYVVACQAQHNRTTALNTALNLLDPDNQVLSLADAVEGPYARLVEHLLGQDLWQWVEWWMYETDFGTKPMQFAIDGVPHNPATLTFTEFFTLVQ